MKIKIVNLIIFLPLFNFVRSEGYFTVTGSNLIRQSGKYHVSITSQDYQDEKVLEIGLKSPKQEVTKNVTLTNGKTQNLEFDVRGHNSDTFSLHVKSLNGEKFEKSVSLNVNKKRQIVLVQTDKSIYKPADKVQFRVLVLNSDTKPLDKSKVQVSILDGAQNIIKKLDNVKLTKGVFQGELQLSDSPVLGTWKISVKVHNGGKETTKDFEVAEYTLPKFEVLLDANPDANFKEGKIRATVKAKYTFGKIAKGNATVTAEVATYSYWDRTESKKVTKTVEVDGKKVVEFDIKNELGIQNHGEEKTVKLVATFKEELTGREQNVTSSAIVHLSQHKITLQKSSEKFKPGLPFSITAVVKKHDKNEPVSDKVNPLKINVKYFYNSKMTCYQNRYNRPWHTFENRQTGTPLKAYECSKQKSYLNESEIIIDNGIGIINIAIPENTTKVDVTAKYLDTKSLSNGIQREESNTDEFIQIKLTSTDLKLSRPVQIDVLSTKNLKQLHYQVISKGDVILANDVEVSDKKEFQIEFKPTATMIPKANLVVFYITNGGEIVSDSVKLEFGNELRNFIDVELSKNQAKPGEDLGISVSTNPNSFVGLLGVDQSVLVLKKGNDIEQSTVFEELAKYNEVDKRNLWIDSPFGDFKSSGAVIITNAKSFIKQFDGGWDDYDFDSDSDSDAVSYRSFAVPMRISGGPLRRTGLISGGNRSYKKANKKIIGNSDVLDIRMESAFDLDSDYAITSGITSEFKPLEIEVRKTFPETWLFDSFDFGSETSNVTISKKVPDTITSWIITGFSVDPNTGLGLTHQPSKFTVFQPFFVTTNLPYSIKRGEVVSIPILVFNYMDSDQSVEVTLFNAESEFEFAEVNEADNQVRRRRSTEALRAKRIFVKSQSGVSVPFMIRPLKVGHITIKVVASSNVAGDGVEKQLIVEPEGVPQFINKAVFIDLRTEPEFKTNFSVEIPPNAVPDSTKIEASAIGDILGPSIENLDKLIKLPYGCGEQNMLNFVPNIVVLDYLKAVDKLTPEIESKAISFLETGYQRELSYKHDDGSYSVFGKSDKSGSTWLTAFVAKSFRQASKYIEIDEKIIEAALNFLSKSQDEDGSFPEVGKVFDKAMQGGASKGLALTAYVLTSFLENQSAAKTYQNTIEKALNYIKQNIGSLDDNYSIAIVSYALQHSNHSLKDMLLAKLEEKSVNEDGKKYWEKAETKSDDKNPWSYRPNSVNVEMTAYALQALIESGRVAETIPILKWLLTQRNENGGFQSTQDTVVGLQAISRLATKIYTPNSRVEISLKHENGNETRIEVNEDNALVLQKYDLPANSKRFDVTAKGQGFSLLQLSYKYNLNVNGEWPRFTVKPKVHENSNKDFLHLIVCTSFVPDESTNTSNMAVMEVELPSGFTFDTDSLPELKSTDNIKRVETKDAETIVILYFDDLASDEICPEIKSYRTHSVAKLKPMPVKVYDYYDNSRQATEFYNPPEISLCDICDGAEECKEDCEQTEITVSRISGTDPDVDLHEKLVFSD